ncbi:hypothetical protein [Streptomyces sp. NPDC020983]|uniref:hypothetical protein n=1 Tax=Streptomyces sp. NPDC020983 TaxID=3365106 RepID=UPI0037B2EF57
MARTSRGWNTKGTWLAGAALAVVVALTGYAVLSGGDDDKGKPTAKDTPTATSTARQPSVSPSATATYSEPDDWTEPDRWTALPRGQRTDSGGSSVGFPQTTEGAVSMMVAANSTAIQGSTSNVDEQLRIFHSYIDKPEQTDQYADQIKQNATASDASLAQQMHVQPGQPLPSGAYLRSAVVGYQVISRSGTEVSAWLLSRVVQKDGEMTKEATSYSRTLAGAQWMDGDWRLTGAATNRAQQAVQGKAQPTIAAPGDPGFNAAGWTAIRQAS